MQLYVHNKNYDEMYKFIPKEYLPKEYGGEAGSIKEITGKISNYNFSRRIEKYGKSNKVITTILNRGLDFFEIHVWLLLL